MKDFTSKDIVAIIKTAGSNNVEEIVIGELRIHFGRAPAPVIEQLADPMPPQREEITLEHKEEASNSQLEIFKAQQMIDDPEGYEARMIDESGA